jgi:HSP20 family molecular chaperone IbpA
MAMTLSGAEWGLRAPFPLPRLGPSRARGRPTLGVGPSASGGPPKPPKRILSPIVERLTGRSRRGVLTVRCCSTGTLALWSARAAIPAATVEERADSVVVSFDIPGASADNTEVVWDAEERRLAVGVWVGTRPRADRRSAFAPELGWYRSKWLPYCDGRRAAARVHDGIVEVVVPRLDPDPAATSRRGPPRRAHPVCAPSAPARG